MLTFHVVAQDHRTPGVARRSRLAAGTPRRPSPALSHAHGDLDRQRDRPDAAIRCSKSCWYSALGSTLLGLLAIELWASDPRAVWMIGVGGLRAVARLSLLHQAAAAVRDARPAAHLLPRGRRGDRDRRGHDHDADDGQGTAPGRACRAGLPASRRRRHQAGRRRTGSCTREAYRSGFLPPQVELFGFTHADRRRPGRDRPRAAPASPTTSGGTISPPPRSAPRVRRHARRRQPAGRREHLRRRGPAGAGDLRPEHRASP